MLIALYQEYYILKSSTKWKVSFACLVPMEKKNPAPPRATSHGAVCKLPLSIYPIAVCQLHHWGDGPPLIINKKESRQK